jgi:hypothetical protein
MHKSTTKCNKTVGKWCKNKHGASKIIDTFETYQRAATAFLSTIMRKEMRCEKTFLPLAGMRNHEGSHRVVLFIYMTTDSHVPWVSDLRVPRKAGPLISDLVGTSRRTMEGQQNQRFGPREQCQKSIERQDRGISKTNGHRAATSSEWTARIISAWIGQDFPKNISFRCVQLQLYQPLFSGKILLITHCYIFVPKFFLACPKFSLKLRHCLDAVFFHMMRRETVCRMGWFLQPLLYFIDIKYIIVVFFYWLFSSTKEKGGCVCVRVHACVCVDYLIFLILHFFEL